MDRDPGDFDKRDSDAPSDRDEDARIDRLLASMTPAPGIRHIDDDDDEEETRIDAEIAAGLVYPHAVVGRWLKTWGQPDRKPFKEWLADQDG